MKYNQRVFVIIDGRASTGFVKEERKNNIIRVRVFGSYFNHINRDCLFVRKYGCFMWGINNVDGYLRDTLCVRHLWNYPFVFVAHKIYKLILNIKFWWLNKSKML